MSNFVTEFEEAAVDVTYVATAFQAGGIEGSPAAWSIVRWMGKLDTEGHTDLLQRCSSI